MTAVKYMDRGWIMKANNYAIKKGWKATLSMTTIYSIKEDTMVPISFMVPEDSDIICVTLTIGGEYDKTKAENHKLHIPWQLWEKLPSVEMPDVTSSDEPTDDDGEPPISDAASKWLMS